MLTGSQLVFRRLNTYLRVPVSPASIPTSDPECMKRRVDSMAAAAASSGKSTPVKKPRKRDVPLGEGQEEGDAAAGATPTPSKKKLKALVMDTSFDMTEELQSKVCVCVCVSLSSPSSPCWHTVLRPCALGPNCCTEQSQSEQGPWGLSCWTEHARALLGMTGAGKVLQGLQDLGPTGAPPCPLPTRRRGGSQPSCSASFPTPRSHWITPRPSSC